MPNPDTYGIYLHIPYCRSKCRYCDFYSTPGTRGVPDEYVTALLRELSKSSRRPDTLYFGGGTPALLRPDQVHRLIKAAAPLPGAEITLEANPDVVTPENLAGFAAAGVTRISFGVQSADDAQLRRPRGPWSTFPYPVLCVLVFLGGGFLFGWWHPGWFVFLTIPLYYWIAHIIENDPNYRANRR